MTTPQSESPRPAAFLDRDGTIIVERHYLSDPDGVELLPRSATAIHLLNELGYWVFGVSNQSGVARGFFTTDQVDDVNTRVTDLLAAEGATIDHIYYCPHYQVAPDRPKCDCRKPLPGLIHQASSDYHIDLSRSFVAGDRAADIGLAKAVGVKGALVLTGYGRDERSRLDGDLLPDIVADDLLAVVQALQFQ